MLYNYVISGQNILFCPVYESYDTLVYMLSRANYMQKS